MYIEVMGGVVVELSMLVVVVLYYMIGLCVMMSNEVKNVLFVDCLSIVVIYWMFEDMILV